MIIFKTAMLKYRAFSLLEVVVSLSLLMLIYVIVCKAIIIIVQIGQKDLKSLIAILQTLY